MTRVERLAYIIATLIGFFLGVIYQRPVFGQWNLNRAIGWEWDIGERLGFLRRLVHGRNPRFWIQEIMRRADEKTDSSTEVMTRS